MKKNTLIAACMIFMTMLTFSCSNSSPTVEPQGTTSSSTSDSPGTDLMTASIVSPLDGAISVRSDANIVISFSEVVDYTTLTGKLSIVGSTSGTHTYSGISTDSQVYSLDPTTDFDDSETVTVTLTSTTASPIESTTGTDLYRGESGSETDTYYQFQFDIAATTATQSSESLVVVADSQNPGPAATDISIDTANIYVAFSGDAIVQYADYTITGSTSGDVRNVSGPVDLDSVVDGVGTVWRLPISSLAYGETVTVTLSTGVTDDTTLILLTQDGEHTWSFTTETASDPLPGTVTITHVYVSNLTSTGAGSATATVNWATNMSITGSAVNYGTNTTYSSTENEAAGSYDYHSVTLSSLAENTLYYYQIDSGGVTATGTFFTTNSDPVNNNPGSAAYESTYDSSDITLIQNENAGTTDGSSYMFWLNNDDVYGILFATDSSITWTNPIDTGTVSDVNAVSDGYGSAVVAMEDASGIRATIVDSTGSTADFNSGSAISTGSAPSVAIVWGAQGNNNVDGGFITHRTDGTAVVFADDANYIYDYDYDLSSIGAADGDIIFNRSLSATNSNNTTVTNLAGITASYRHVIQQTADIVNTGNAYHIGDVSSAYGPYSVTDYDIYESSPEALVISYTNPAAGEILDDIYSPYTTTPFDIGEAVADHILKITDASANSYFRRLSSSNEITFGTSGATHLHSEPFSPGTTDAAVTTTHLIDATADFSVTGPYAVQINDIVENASGAYARVLDNSNAAQGELILSNSIFTTSSENYYIYSRTLKVGPRTATTWSANWIEDTNYDLSSVTAGTDLAFNTATSQYSDISSRDADNLYLASSIMTTSGYAVYTPTLEVSGSTTSNLLIDTANDFTISVADSDIVENTSTPAFVKVIRAYDGYLAIDTDSFSSGSEGYTIYAGEYNYTGYPSDMFTGFVHIALDANTATISDDSDEFTIYDSLDFGGGNLFSTADTRPANPLFDNTGVFVTSSVSDNDVVFNTTAETFTRVDTTTLPFTVKERAVDLDIDIFTTDGHTYSIFTFNPDVPDADIIATGSATTTGNPFTDSGADFSTDGVKKGDLIYNITDHTYAVVTTVTSASQLALNKNIMNTSGDVYAVFRSDEYILEAGTAGTAGATFTDTNANFTVSGIQAGDIVRNQTDSTEGIVTSVDSATQLTLDSNIMNTVGDRYVILQPRALFVYENGGGIYATLVNMRDGSLYDQDYDGVNTNDEITIAAAGSNPRVISNGLGSAFIVYENGGTIYVRRTNGNCSSTTGSYSITGTILDIKSDNSNGIYLLFQNGASVGIDRLSTPAASAWGGAVTWTGTGAVMAVDPSGDPTVAFIDATPDIQIRGLQQSDGTTDFSNTILTSGYTYLTTVTALSITADQSDSGGTDVPGGFIIAWADDRYYTSFGFGIYAQAVDDSGSLVWNTDSSGTDYTGMTVGLTGAIDETDVLTKTIFYDDGTIPYGGLFIWLDYRNSQADIYYDTLAR